MKCAFLLKKYKIKKKKQTSIVGSLELQSNSPVGFEIEKYRPTVTESLNALNYFDMVAHPWSR